MESNEWPLKTPVLGLRILQPEATCFLWLCTPAFLTERERPRMDPLMPPQGSILIPFSFSSLDPSFSRFSIHYQNYFPRTGKKRRLPTGNACALIFQLSFSQSRRFTNKLLLFTPFTVTRFAMQHLQVSQNCIFMQF